MADEWTAPLTVEQMYGDWFGMGGGLALTDMSPDPRPSTSFYTPRR